MILSKQMRAGVAVFIMTAGLPAFADTKFAINIAPSEAKSAFLSMSGDDLPTLKLCTDTEVTVLLQLNQEYTAMPVAEGYTERTIETGECIFVRAAEISIENATREAARVTATLFD